MKLLCTYKRPDQSNSKTLMVCFMNPWKPHLMTNFSITFGFEMYQIASVRRTIAYQHSIGTLERTKPTAKMVYL